MKFFDAHVHLAGGETPDDVARWMDAHGVERLALISQNPVDEPMSHKEIPTEIPRGRPAPPEEQRRRVEHLGRIVKALGSRVTGCAWIDPTTRGVAELARAASEEHGIRGIKLIPLGWYPHEERFYPLYELARELDMPLLFHTGILWLWGDTSRFCRPVELEFLLQFGGLRFAMAHVAWPWTDECLAVAQKFLAMNRAVGRAEVQAYVDLTPGTPAIYREDVLRKAIALLGAKRLLWGSDTSPGTSYPSALVESDAKVFASLGLSEEEIGDVFAGNAMRFYGVA